MNKVPLERMSKAIRSEVLKAIDGPVVVTAHGEPILIVRNLLEDEVADELIAQNPEFRASIERARRQKASGQTKTIAQLREKYASQESPGHGESPG